ncbi:hypothetical protein GWK47_037888 [Chionoecetes opilio]|uniref:Uncharacterized protein n=1 Tax=Chionoecetes opilio TaxID=41210 RepID=A0A8J4YEH9_CHIOP|nr:hypothetical protein GWK47_037888 [Chionoecetes opilio]
MTVTVERKEFQLLERFTVIIYNKKSKIGLCERGSRELFSQKKKDNGEHSPKQEAFCSTHCAQSTKLESGQPVIIVSRKPPTSEGFGWTLESATKTWRSVCSNLPVASQARSRTDQNGCKSAMARVEDDAHARRRGLGNAHNFAAADVRSSLAGLV